jgi:D-alanyl-D-alanine carboxypeptidase
MTRRRLAFALCAAGIATSGLAAGAPSAGAKDFSPSVQRQLTLTTKNNMTDSRLPGAAVGVWVPGRGSYVRSFGIGNRRTGRPARVGDHVRIASITKTFTGTAILQLVDRGRLSLDDHLSKYVGGVPNGDAITIRQMLHMTSGIYDFTSDDALAQSFYANPRLAFTESDFLAVLGRHEPAFAPGAAVEYSDSNYYLLGMIAEKVTGDPLHKVIRDQILRPLRLTNTSYPTGQSLPKPFARGYFGGLDFNDPLTDATIINPAFAGGAGAMESTLGDLRKWAKALVTGRLLSRSLQAQRLQTVSFPNPGPVDVGYGLGIFKLDKLLGHNGAAIGYSTAMFYLPSNGATIVVWGNNSTNDSTPTTTIAFDIAEILFPKAVDEGESYGPS